MSRVAVIGAGAFGTALACVVRRAGSEAVIWARDPAIADSITSDKGNPVYLPGVALEPGIAATTDLAAALEGADAVLLVVPSQFLRAATENLAPLLPAGVPVVLCAKGIERGSCALMTEVVAETLPGAPVAVLSGPTFAKEVAAGLPTAITLATTDAALGARLVATIGSTAFRPYLSDDPVGAEIGGAVKNVIAIACGIMVGRGLGDNARAATMTRGLAEILRLGHRLGGRGETLMGLAGIGDLSLTCNGMLSRNMTLGLALGEGRPLQDILGERRAVTEGVATAASVVELAARHEVDMPISQAVNRIVNEGADVGATIAEVLARPFRPEFHND
ncbi:MAG: NAD(P)-dependent glycerol-3-phosphate dehydrogenase [Alphaproteobacteria bacterium]|nr:NAD(P)-dependent glycerol-3-phosphate dehydrogenase [Alphaproteobacteria bacterium]